MGSTWTSITDGTDLQSVDLINEIINAFNERVQSIYGGTSWLPKISPGTDIQDSYFWSFYQEFIDTNFNSLGPFFQFFIDPTQAQPFHYNTTPNPQNFITEDKWKTLSGLTNGFRRAETSYPSDWTNYNDPAFTYGHCQAGDIIGPWLWKDLQDAISPLLWRESSYNWDNKGEKNYRESTYQWASTWTNAKAKGGAVQAELGGSVWPLATSIAFVNYPQAWSSGLYLPNFGYSITLTREYCYMKVTPPCFIPYDVDFYVPNGVNFGDNEQIYDDNGDQINEFGYNYIGTDTNIVGVSYSGRVGPGANISVMTESLDDPVIKSVYCSLPPPAGENSPDIFTPDYICPTDCLKVTGTVPSVGFFAPTQYDINGHQTGFTWNNTSAPYTITRNNANNWVIITTGDNPNTPANPYWKSAVGAPGSYAPQNGAAGTATVVYYSPPEESTGYGYVGDGDNGFAILKWHFQYHN